MMIDELVVCRTLDISIVCTCNIVRGILILVNTCCTIYYKIEMLDVDSAFSFDISSRYLPN
ncbi:hypothetical protein ACF0H5_016088 [Mactra antiquata]